jgi:hypothetical protein
VRAEQVVYLLQALTHADENRLAPFPSLAAKQSLVQNRRGKALIDGGSCRTYVTVLKKLAILSL